MDGEDEEDEEDEDFASSNNWDRIRDLEDSNERRLRPPRIKSTL